MNEQDDDLLDIIPFDKILTNNIDLTHLYLNRLSLGKHLDELALLTHCLSKNTNIIVLDLSHNKLKDHGLKYIRDIIENNSSITNLDISFNKFSPCAINKITPLMKTNLTITQIHIEEYSTVTKGILKNLSCPRVALARRDIYETSSQNSRLQLAINEASNKISLSNRYFTSIPDILFPVKWLVKLNLSGNCLQTIPKELYQLSSLTVLNISDNMICNLESKNITNLEKLQHLDLQNNLLSLLPFRLSKLPLVSVNIKDNLIHSHLSIPFHNFDKEIKLLKNGSIKPLVLKLIIPLFGIYFIGILSSNIRKIFGFLNNFEYDSLKFLSTKERIILITCNNNLKQSEGIYFDTWVPENIAISNRKSTAISPRLSHVYSVKISVPRTASLQTDNNSLSITTLNPTACVYKYYHINCNIIDMKKAEYIQSILFSGFNSRFPIIIGYKISTDIDTILFRLVRLLYSIDTINEESSVTTKIPIFIIGTYNKAIEKMRNIVKIINNTISRKFPWINISFYSISTSNGDKIKKLKDKIIKKSLEKIDSENIFPFLPSNIGNKWILKRRKTIYQLIETIKCIREDISDITDEETKYSKSFMKRKDFENFIIKEGFIERECKLVIDFLRNIGLIYHFGDINLQKHENYEFSVENLIFFNIECIFVGFNSVCFLYRNQSDYIKKGSIFKGIHVREVYKIWKNIPTDLYHAMYTIYNYTGQTFSLYKKYFVIPNMFDDSPQSLANITKPNWLPETNSYYIVRSYSFYRMLDRNYCNLIRELNYFLIMPFSYGEIKIENVYKYCLDIGLYENNEKKAHSRIVYNYLQNRVTLYSSEYIKEHNLFKSLSSKLEEIFSSDTTLQRTNPPVFVLCICNKCSNSKEPKWIPLSEIEELAAKGKMFYKCSDNDLVVRLDMIAPDISFSSLDHLFIDYSDINIIKQLGKGGFATVHLGKIDENYVAVKQLEQTDSLGELVPEFRKEAELMSGLTHPNILGLISLCKNPFCVITEFCPFGDLFSYIKSRKERKLPFPEKYIFHLLTDIAKGMAFLHGIIPPIIHRDLKSPNILLLKPSPDEFNLDSPYSERIIEDIPESNVIAKISDFGLSLQTYTPITKRVVSNPIWLAPELLACKPYSTTSDVYAFGIIAYEIISLEFPFDEYDYEFMFKLEKMIIDGVRPTLPVNMNYHLKTLIETCWDPIASERPTFSAIVRKLAWIQRLATTTLLKRSKRTESLYESINSS